MSRTMFPVPNIISVHMINGLLHADLIQEIDSKLPVVQLALELTHKIFGSCPPMQSFDPAKMLTDSGKLQTLDITVACRKSSCSPVCSQIPFWLCKVTSTSVPPSPWSPRSQTEILQLGNLKPFSFNVLKLATRNFRHDSVLGEGGSGSVLKGWIDEQSVKRLNREIFKVFKNGSFSALERRLLRDESVHMVDCQRLESLNPAGRTHQEHEKHKQFLGFLVPYYIPTEYLSLLVTLCRHSRQVLAVTMRFIQKDAEEKKTSFNPRPYLKLFIDWLLDLSTLDPVFEGANFQVGSESSSNLLPCPAASQSSCTFRLFS
ncbi:unnamed protein product [Lactuca virosa]|uniref:Uncharacterized protein n=1 Tax=Lactuca virosa TaxID=75947 RepID=A0AAU9LDK6_9ASTR|nr:unnamed protein product [Lactuca virosa]